MTDEDLIRRGDALEAVTDTSVKWGFTGEPAILIDTKAAIRALPAQVQPAPVALTIKPDLSEVRSMLDSAEKQWKHLDHIAATIRVNAMRHGATDAEIEAFIKGDADFVEWLSAQVAPQPAPVAVEVKPLEWVERGTDFWRVQGIDRVYEVIAMHDGRFFLTNGPRLCDFPTLESAQAAAQADHSARILSAVNLRPVAEVQAESVAGAMAERDALRVELNALRVEAEKAFGADEEIAEAWDAIGTRGNPRVLSLPEQISSIIRELDAALDAEAAITPADAQAALDRRDAATREAALREAAKFIAKRRDGYIKDHGSYDYSTGVTEFPGNGEEAVQEWDELEDAILAMIKEPTHD